MNIETAIKQPVWAVLGATDRTNKFGYKIYAHLRNRGYTVYPVNPRIAEIDGSKCYPSLKDLPEVPQVVDFVVPEVVGLPALDMCARLGVSTVWLQPGADTSSVVERAQALDLNVITDCVLVQIP